MCTQYWLTDKVKNSVIRLTDHSDLAIAVYCGCKETTQQYENLISRVDLEMLFLTG